MSEKPATRKRLNREESKERTRKLLLEAAEEVFARRGFGGASVEEVAEAAGFSKGAVYSNFGSKDDLFLSLIDYRLERTVGPNWVQVFSQGTLEGRVEGSDQLLKREGGIPWTVLETEFFLYATRNPAFREKMAERYEGIRREIAETLTRHFSELGVTPPVSPEVLAWVLPAAATGLEMQKALDPEAVPEEVWTDVLRVLLGGSA